MNNIGYIVTNTDSARFKKITNKVTELGGIYYSKLKCEVKINKGRELLFKCDVNLIQPMQLLDFSFAGLYTDEERIKEIENFGKYRCEISYLTDDNEDWDNANPLF